MMGIRHIAAVTPLLMLLASLAAAADTQAAKLLSDAADTASLLKSDLGTIAFFGLSENGWQNHSPIVASYRGHIATLRMTAERLASARQAASRWQRISIDRVIPVIQDLTAAAEALFAAIDKNPNALSSANYQQYVKLNNDLAGEFSSLISTWVNYAKTSEELSGVASKIGAPAPPGQ